MSSYRTRVHKLPYDKGDGQTDRRTDKLNPISLRFTGDNKQYIIVFEFVYLTKLWKYILDLHISDTAPWTHALSIYNNTWIFDDHITFISHNCIGWAQMSQTIDDLVFWIIIIVTFIHTFICRTHVQVRLFRATTSIYGKPFEMWKYNYSNTVSDFTSEFKFETRPNYLHPKIISLKWNYLLSIHPLSLNDCNINP